MNNVRELKQAEDPRKAEVIRILEGLLARAKSGEFVSVLAVMDCVEGDSTLSTMGQQDLHKTVGQLEAIKHALIQRIFGQ